MKSSKQGSYKMITRLIRIHELIASGSYPNTSELSKELENTESTIKRDIEELRNTYYAPIEYSPFERGYFYTDKNYKPDFSNNDDEDDELSCNKEELAKYFCVPASYFDMLKEITNLKFRSKTKLETNLEKKYCGRSFFDGSIWVGLRVFDFSSECYFCVSILEPYGENKIYSMLKRKKKNFFAEESSIDEGYWLNVFLDKKLIETSPEVARMGLTEFINFLRN